jgi:hypothetical protein
MAWQASLQKRDRGTWVALTTANPTDLPDCRQLSVSPQEGLMRLRILTGVFLLVALAGASAVAARGTSFVGPDKQWTIANFQDAVLVKGRFVMGPVLIVHDSAKMARGEACTTFYRFDPARGPREEILSFHCQPRNGQAAATTAFTTALTAPGCKRLVEYQIAGDVEVHGIPER